MSETELTSSHTDEFAASTTESLASLSEAIESTFAELSQSVADDLARLSIEGRSSVREMVEGILEDLARRAAEELIGSSLQHILPSGLKTEDRPTDNIVNVLQRGIRNG